MSISQPKTPEDIQFTITEDNDKQDTFTNFYTPVDRQVRLRRQNQNIPAHCPFHLQYEQCFCNFSRLFYKQSAD